MKIIKNVPIYDRLYLSPIISALRGDMGMVHSGVKVLSALRLSEGETKLSELQQTGDKLLWNRLTAPVVNLKFEDRDYEFLMSVFDQRDKEKVWEINEDVDFLIKRFRKAEDFVEPPVETAKKAEI